MEAKRTADEMGFGGLKLIQRSGDFRYGIDAVLLADFAAKICAKGKRGKLPETAADLGSASGVIPLILSHKCGLKKIYAIEKQRELAELAAENAELNGLSDRISAICADVAEFDTREAGLRGALDMVVSNPPYVARGRGPINSSDGRLLARQETSAGISDFARLASELLKDKGDFCVVYRPSRMAELFACLREHRLEPRTLRFVSPERGRAANILLLHAVKGGGRELKLLPELYVYESRGRYSGEILEIYEREVV